MALSPNAVQYSLLGVAAGGGLSVYGWLFDREERSLAQAPLTPVGSLQRGNAAVVTGAVSCPALTYGPASAKPCAFYREEVQVLRVGRVGTGRKALYGEYWQVASERAIGGFFVTDPSGKAFVAAAGAKADCLQHKEESREGAGLVEGDTWTRELRIDEGDNATVLGTPHSLGELIDYMGAREGGPTLPPELIEVLLRLQGAGEDFPCFYCDGAAFLVSGEGYEAFKKDLESSANAWLSVGLLIGGLSAFILIAAWLGFV